MTPVRVIGAGLAGCEAAWQISRLGVPVILSEMKPKRFSPAHRHPGFAELVCSNSLRSAQLSNAVGLLKEEMRRLGSLILTSADDTKVPAGAALAVDRVAFSDLITQRIKEKMGFDMTIPSGFFISKDEPDFLWIRKELEKNSFGIS